MSSTNKAISGTVTAAYNSAFLLCSQILSKLASFCGIIILARYLGIADFGTYSLAFAIAGIIAIFTEFGLGQLQVREISRNKGHLRSISANVILIKLVFATVSLAITAFVLSLSGLDPKKSSVLLLFTVALIPIGVFHSLVMIFMGIERMVYFAICTVASELLRLALMAWVLMTGHGLVPLAWSYVAASLLSMFLTYLVARRVAGPLISTPNLVIMRNLLRESIPFLFYSLFFLIYFKIDFIMLAAMKGEEVVGVYAGAYRLMESFLFVPAAFMGAVFPGLSRLSHTGDDSILAASQKTLRYMAMIGIPFGFGTAVLARPIVLFLFGDSYSESVLPLQIVIWALVLIFLNCICPVGLNATDRQLFSALITGIGILINVILNLILIPPYGAVGTSISTVLTEISVTALFFFFFRLHIGRLHLFSACYKPAGASLAMATGLLVVTDLPLGVMVVGGALFYFAGLVLTRALNREDFRLFARLLRPAAIGREA